MYSIVTFDEYCDFNFAICIALYSLPWKWNCERSCDVIESLYKMHNHKTHSMDNMGIHFRWNDARFCRFIYGPLRNRSDVKDYCRKGTFVLVTSSQTENGLCRQFCVHRKNRETLVVLLCKKNLLVSSQSQSVFFFSLFFFWAVK